MGADGPRAAAFGAELGARPNGGTGGVAPGSEPDELPREGAVVAAAIAGAGAAAEARGVAAAEVGGATANKGKAEEELALGVTTGIASRALGGAERQWGTAFGNNAGSEATRGAEGRTDDAGERGIEGSAAGVSPAGEEGLTTPLERPRRAFL
jgi:hypothetical protein